MLELVVLKQELAVSVTELQRSWHLFRPFVAHRSLPREIAPHYGRTDAENEAIVLNCAIDREMNEK